MLDANTNTKTQPGGTDPEQITRQLDLELSMKRAQWKQAKAKRRNLRMASVLFLFLLIAGCVFAFMVLIPQLRERAQSGAAHTSGQSMAKP